MGKTNSLYLFAKTKQTGKRCIQWLHRWVYEHTRTGTHMCVCVGVVIYTSRVRYTWKSFGLDSFVASKRLYEVLHQHQVLSVHVLSLQVFMLYFDGRDNAQVRRESCGLCYWGSGKGCLAFLVAYCSLDRRDFGSFSVFAVTAFVCFCLFLSFLVSHNSLSLSIFQSSHLSLSLFLSFSVPFLSLSLSHFFSLSPTSFSFFLSISHLHLSFSLPYQSLCLSITPVSSLFHFILPYDVHSFFCHE